jgi:hypothetical protein
MLAFLLSILPEYCWILIVALAGLCLMLGIISRQTAFGIVGIIILLALLIPFIDAFFMNLDLWILILLMVIFSLVFIRWIFNLLFGKRTTDHLVALLLRDIFFLPFRFVRYLIRRKA